MTGTGARRPGSAMASSGQTGGATARPPPASPTTPDVSVITRRCRQDTLRGAVDDAIAARATTEDGPAAGWSFSCAGAQGEMDGDGHGGDAGSADDHGQIQPGAVGVAGGHAERAMGATSGGDGLGEAGLGAGPVRAGWPASAGASRDRQRSDKTARNYHAALCLAATLLWAASVSEASTAGADETPGAVRTAGLPRTRRRRLAGTSAGRARGVPAAHASPPASPFARRPARTLHGPASTSTSSPGTSRR